MQVFGLPGHVIRNARAASRLLDAKTSSFEAAGRRDAVRRWRLAMANGLTAAKAAEAVGVPRATLYRWQNDPEPKSRRPKTLRSPRWSHDLVVAVQAIRDDNPFWGKRKIVAILIREGVATCASTVGRVLASLVARGAVTPVPILRRKPQGRTFRFTQKQRYARRLKKGRKAKEPGELVQIDTLFVNIRPDKPIKHFTAHDPISKWTIGHVATSASATNATVLLDKLVATAPFKVRGIQVDGGSEFMAGFENACERHGLELVVLPPKRPDLNGGVERAQGTWRYEFYACHDLPHRIADLIPYVDAFAHRHNTWRPHDTLGGQTPAEYLATHSAGNPKPSHMS